MKNSELCKTDSFFIECCKEANVEPTQRQYSKFKNKKGIAYKVRGRIKQKNRESS